MSKISVLIKEPGEPAYHIHIENSLEVLQETVGGFIETVTLSEDYVLICNEEGRIWDLPLNFNMFGQGFFGTVIIAGVDGEEFCDIPLTMEQAKKILPGLFEGIKSDRTGESTTDTVKKVK